MSSDFADKIIKNDIFDGFLGTPVQFAIWADILLHDVGWPFISKLKGCTVTYK